MKFKLKLIYKKFKSIKTSFGRAMFELYIRISTYKARRYLKIHGPLMILIDSSALGHGITHASAWVSTGNSMWGDIAIPTGYFARVSVHSAESTDRSYKEVKFLIGIAELARSGLIELVTSAELQAETARQPLGRFRGYGIGDLNIFEGIPIRSLDGYKLDYCDATKKQIDRIRSRSDEPFATINRFLPEKSNLDAWHLHTAHIYKAFCFLTMDFKLWKNLKSSSRRRGFPQLDTKLLLPSELAATIGLLPIEAIAISHRSAIFPVHPELSLSDGRRQPQSQQDKSTDQEVAGNHMAQIPDMGQSRRVKRINGAEITHEMEAVNIQYENNDGNLETISMDMGNALYLLSILKSMQLDLDIPFPDDPRNPNDRPIRPSEVKTSNVNKI